VGRVGDKTETGYERYLWLIQSTVSKVKLHITSGFVRGSSSDLSHHESWHLGGELQQVGELLRHAAGWSISKDLKQTDQFNQSLSYSQPIITVICGELQFF